MQYGHSLDVRKYFGHRTEWFQTSWVRKMQCNGSLERLKMCLNMTQLFFFLTVFWHLLYILNGLRPLCWSHTGRLCTHPDNKVSLLINRHGTKWTGRLKGTESEKENLMNTRRGMEWEKLDQDWPVLFRSIDYNNGRLLRLQFCLHKMQVGRIVFLTK